MTTHPGELIMSDVLLPAHLSIRQAAGQLDISPETLADIVRGQSPITEAIAARLAREFGYSRRIWMALQAEWDREQRVLT